MVFCVQIFLESVLEVALILKKVRVALHVKVLILVHLLDNFLLTHPVLLILYLLLGLEEDVEFLFEGISEFQSGLSLLLFYSIFLQLLL
mmetsp:Transcript_24638/g.24234  ORF Transcript_24638/g.24234 Transcript_24638/m.24234 type:complete len:89 (-) Transcript_24638:480-746(-)